jgi:hypothetical protein
VYGPNTPRLGDPGADNRTYCTTTNPPPSEGWFPIVTKATTTKGGLTIGTHHIDTVVSPLPSAANAAATATATSTAMFVRVRLLEVLDAARPPLLTFKVLNV